jgi:hypothetical protein
MYGPPGDQQVGDAAIDLTATNTGQAPVTLSSAKFWLRGKGKDISLAPMEWVVQTPGSLPIRLESGDHWTGLVHVRSMKASADQHFGARSHWHVRPVLTDTAGRRYGAKIAWRRLLPRRWMRLEERR